jgi:TonB-linked SusC/RagA family outer membrane protein
MKKLILLRFAPVILSFLFFSFQTNAQQKIITGVVVNAEGSGIPSATVLVKETNEKTVTSEAGRFSIKATAGQHLEVSSIGYLNSSIAIKAGSAIRIILAASRQELGEVIVTALGISRQKKALGYSVQDVSGEALSEVKPTNIVNALSGKVAGVQITNASGAVGGSSRIVIRGNHSFGQNEPLWVVDGTPFINFSSDQDAMSGQDYGNGALDLDPSNIESISVLKGANATALYGSRGANGVVLVTTKKGSKAKNKIGIDVSSSVSFENAYILPAWQNSYGGGSHGDEYYWKKDQPAMTYQDYAKKYGFNWVDGYGGGVNDATPKSWGPRLDVGLVLDQFTGKNQPWISHPDNMKDFFETGITKDNSIAISKASDAGSMRLFLSNMAVKGTTPNTDYTKYTAGFSSELNLSKRLTAGINMTYVNNHSDNLPSMGYDGGGDNPSASFSFFQRQVDIAPLKAHWNELDAFGHPYSYSLGEMNNPYADANNNASRTRNRLYGNVNLKLKATDWLSVLGRIGTDYYNEERKKTLRSISYDGNGTGKFWQSDKFAQETNADLLFLFDKKINDQFRIDGTVGANYRIESSHQVRINGS